MSNAEILAELAALKEEVREARESISKLTNLVTELIDPAILNEINMAKKSPHQRKSSKNHGVVVGYKWTPS